VRGVVVADVSVDVGLTDAIEMDGIDNVDELDDLDDGGDALVKNEHRL
jgi:hypothetical protein